MSNIDIRALLGVPKHANQHRLSRLTMEVHTDELRIMASAVESYTDELIAALEAAEKRIAELEARDVKPVAWLRESALKDIHTEAWTPIIHMESERMGADLTESYGVSYIPLYTAPPAPVSVPDERAELQGADGTLISEGTMPATQIKPVADLYGISVPGGRTTTYSTDAAEASDCRVMGWSVQEYVKLERYQAAMLQGAEPVTTAYKLSDDFDFDRFNDVVWLEAVASNPHMHSPTTSVIAMVALELHKRLETSNSPVIPDGLRLALSNAGIAAPESDEMLAATCEKYIQELVTLVKDRKPFRPAVIPDGWVACSERMPGEVLAALQNVARLRRNLNDFCGDKSLIAKCLSEAEGALLNAVNRHSTMLAEPLNEAKNV